MLLIISITVFLETHLSDRYCSTSSYAKKGITCKNELNTFKFCLFMILIKNLNSLHLFKLLFYLGYKDGDTYKMTDDAVTKAAQRHNPVS